MVDVKAGRMLANKCRNIDKIRKCINSFKNHPKPSSETLLRMRIFTRSHSITPIDWILDFF